jgi:predicted nucleic acid-binding protein
MTVLVDTCVWSLGLRRRQRDLNPIERSTYYEWADLLKRGEAAITGVIRQELLSGIVSQKEFESLRDRLALVDDLFVDSHTHILAAEFYNQCRAYGIVPDSPDMTICAAAHLYGMPVFTTDPDFLRYEHHLPIKLHRL